MNTFIENKNGEKICVLVEQSDSPKGLVFVAHGLGGYKEQPHIRAFIEAFLEEGLSVVSFDARRGLGESEGTMEFADATSYYEDLKEVIDWAKKQTFYQEPFFMTGHSIGSLSIGLYAENYPEEVKAIAPISAVISGKLILSTKRDAEGYEKTGWWITPSRTKPGAIKKIRWKNYKEDIMKYDLFKDINKLQIPVLLIVGENDCGTPVKYHQMFFDKLPGEKELHIIKDAHHTFTDTNQLKEIKIILKNWIEKNL